MTPFKLHRPGSVEAAKAALTSADDGKYLAGGQTLIPVLKQRLAMPSDLVALGRIPGIEGVKVEGTTVIVGAMTRHADVARSDEVRRLLPALAELAGGIGDPHVRNRGTIGGSLANNDPAADYPAAVLGLGATVITDRRRIAADAFFRGLFTTALEADEIVTSVSFPIPKRAGYVKFPNPASRYCLVGVLAAATGDGPRVAVTGAGEAGVHRQPVLESLLAKSFDVSALHAVDVSHDGLLSDLHADARYRAHLVGVLARRAVEKAVAGDSTT